MNHIKSLFTLLILACFSCCLNGSLLLARSADTQSSSVLAQPVDEQNSLLLEQSTSEAGLSLLTLSAGETSSLSPVNISLHMRSAYHNEFVGSPLKFDDGGFRFDQVIVDVAGEISPKLSYKYLQRLNKASPIFTKENLPNSIDYAYLRYRFNERFSVTAGKQALTIGGFEYNKYPVEVYDYSGINNLVNCYLNGLQVAFTPRPNQEFTFQVVNNRWGTVEDAIGTPVESSGTSHVMRVEAPTVPLYYSLGWNSNYFDNALQLRYGANVTSPAKGKTLFMLSGGQKWRSDTWRIYVDVLYQRSDIDYLGAIRGATATPGAMVENVEYFTLLGELNYRFQPRWNILLKCFYNNFSVYEKNSHVDSGNCLTSWNYQGGLEFYPMKDDNLHLFLTATLKKFSKPEVKQIITPTNSFRVSAGFIYRIPVLSVRR
jgi:hypothetical protein